MKILKICNLMKKSIQENLELNLFSCLYRKNMPSNFDLLAKNKMKENFIH